MSIRYNFVSVDPQKGPTCWYTAIEIMLLPHGLITGQGIHAENWRQLQKIRDIIFELDKKKQKTEFNEILEEIKRESEICEDENKKQWLVEIKEKFSLAKNTERFKLFEAFLPGCIETVNSSEILKPNYIGDFLTKYGPLYASVSRPGSGFNDHHIVKDPLSLQNGYVYSFDEKINFGGLHAIVIFGIDDKENVYYIDPVYPHRFTMIPWEKISEKLNSPGGTGNGSLYGKVNCLNCNHLPLMRV